MAVVDGLAVREIARQTGLSRNTIKKYLKSGEVEPQYPVVCQNSSLRHEARR